MGNDVVWSVASESAAGAFSIGGYAGGQSLLFSPITLTPGASYAVTVTGRTTPADVTQATSTGTLPNMATVSAANEAPSLQNQRASATVTVHAARPPQTGDFATIGFWQNYYGLALIQQLNGGSGATALGNWLAANFPHLFGASVDPGNPLERNLTNAANSAVGSYILTLFGSQGLDKTYAQIMAVALGAYVTSSTLAGGTYARPYGFNVSAGGSGDDAVNVGTNGLALGLPNNKTQTVLALLQAADNAAANKTLEENLGAANTLFSGINQAGDILSVQYRLGRALAIAVSSGRTPVVYRGVRASPVGR
jgi:hypothetical protein